MIDWPLDKMLQKILLISMCCAAAYGSGRLSIIDTPKSLHFKPTAVPLPSSSLSEVVAAALGYPVQESVDWPALSVVDPFGTPVVAVVVFVTGTDEVALAGASKVSYALSGNGAQASVDRLDERLPKAEHLELSPVSEDKTSKQEKYVALKPASNAAERAFIAELKDLETLAERIQASAERPAFVSTGVPFTGLAGSSKAARVEAQKLFARAVETLGAALQTKFNGEALLAVAAVENDAVVQRSKRQAPAVDPLDLNLAENYNDDYPVIFNIILWFGIVFAFSLLSISYVIGYMDPGRDSIIYRMTSTRIKKDN